MLIIASFEVAGLRHLILAEPSDRTGIVDTFCGKDFNRTDGYCYVGIPGREQACSDCAKGIDAVKELLDTPRPGGE